VKVLVTGATGLIGGSLVRRLGSEHELICVCRREPPSELQDAAEWIRADLSMPIDRRSFPKAIDGIVHLAQSDRYRDFPQGSEDLFAVNVASTNDLLEYGRNAGARAFVLASTGGCYEPRPEPVDEGAPLRPPGPYFRSKRMAELLLENYADLFGGAILRLFFVYGPGPAERLVPRLAQKIVRGEEVVIEGDPGMRLNPIFADDASAAIAAALALERQEVVNVAGPEVVTITELVNRLARALGRPASVRHTDARAGDLVADTTRMNDRLGIAATTTLDRGLAAVAGSIGATSAPRTGGDR